MDSILQAMNEAEKLLPRSKPLVGIACSPAVELALRKHCEEFCSISVGSPVFAYGSYYMGAQILIDSRMTGQNSEVYYCPKLWGKRVKEQNEYDNYQTIASIEPSFGMD